MKKYLFIASAAVLFAACSSSNDNVNEIVEETPIQFEEYLGKATKAEIASEQALAQAGGFYVWGYKVKNTGDEFKTAPTSMATGQTAVFTKVPVKGTDVANPVWSYEDTKYWDKTCSYNFFAGGPVNHTTGTLAWANDKFTVTGAASALATATTSDFVIDREVNFVNAATRTAGTNVAFDFHHIMAKVSFYVKKASTLKSTDVVILNSLTMSGWNEKTGNFEQKKFDGTWAELNTTEWTLASASTAGVTDELIASDITLTTEAQELEDMDYVMVPQAITYTAATGTAAAKGLTFTLTYTLNNEEFSNQVAVVPSTQTWGTDSHTVYTIIVGPEAIKFDVTSVCDFCLSNPAAPDVPVQ